MVAWLKRRKWFVVGAVALVLGGVVAVLVRPAPPGPYVPPVRARVYTSGQACLLTDSQGVTSAAAGPVWSGMQSASARNSEMVTFLAVAGPPTSQNVQAFVNTLASRQCTVVIAVGAPEVQAVVARAAAFPGQKFIVVGAAAQQPNVSVVAPGAAASVTTAIRGDLIAE